tara:strand:+ start:685 stop:987 length:303 start_codon:yes stop_codon:yes gene_type:complete
MEDKVKIFLDKVLDRLKDRTNFEVRDDGKVYWAYPYHQSLLSAAAPYHSNSPDGHFHNNCRDVYGLTNREIRYVWDRYYEWLVNELSKKKHPFLGNTSNE